MHQFLVVKKTAWFIDGDFVKRRKKEKQLIQISILKWNEWHMTRKASSGRLHWCQWPTDLMDHSIWDLPDGAFKMYSWLCFYMTKFSPETGVARVDLRTILAGSSTHLGRRYDRANTHLIQLSQLGLVEYQVVASEKMQIPFTHNSTVQNITKEECEPVKEIAHFSPPILGGDENGRDKKGPPMPPEIRERFDRIKLGQFGNFVTGGVN